MPDNKESLNFGEELWNHIKKLINKLRTFTNIDLKENLGAKTVKVEPSKQQEELLKSHGEICDAIGSKLIVIRNDDGCMLFKLTEENGIEQIDLGNVYKAKNISRIFKELFVIEGDNKVEMIKFNPDNGETWESLGVFKRYQKGWKDPKDRTNRWVTCFRDGGTSETFYANDYLWDIPNFKLISNK